MKTNTELYGDLQIICAADKSYCWAKTTSTRQVEALHEFAETNGYQKYFGRTPSNNYYGVVDGEVRLLKDNSECVVRGTYQDGDNFKDGVFRVIIDDVAPVEESLPEEAQPAPIEEPTPEVQSGPQPVPPEEPAEVPDEPVVEEPQFGQQLAPDYEELYHELVERYNELAAQYNETANALATIQQAFDVLKQLLK